MKDLSLDDLALAEFKALQNAQELIVESKLLSRHGYMPRAWTLASLALEEIAKAYIFSQAALTILNGVGVSWEELYKFF